MKKIVCALLLACVCAGAFAQNAADFTVQGKVLTEYKGTATAVVIPASLGITEIGRYSFFDTNITSIIIPTEVTTIGDCAFSECESLISVTIPAGVTSLGNWVFSGCTSLTGITVDGRNPVYTSIDGVVFNKTKTTLILYPNGKQDKTYAIPAGVTSIGDHAFYGCESLTAITLPAGLTSIGDHAFYGCESLTDITLPARLTSIGENAFSFCTSLTNITVPAGVTSIRDWAFFGCTSLATITIPAGVTSVGWRAFAECDALSPAIKADIKKRFGEDVFYKGES